MKPSINELLNDKSAMEGLKWEQLKIERDGEFGKEIDELCALNNPGLFKHHGKFLGMPKVDQVLEALKSEQVDIAVTPHGMADAPINGMFAKPHITRQTVNWLLNKLKAPETEKHYYFQSQDDNLESLSHKCGLPRRLKHGSRFLGEQQAANLWIGGHKTVSRLHSDNFDNIYVQLSGKKRVYLIPPQCIAEVEEKVLVSATYNSNMQLVKDKPTSPEYATTLFPTVDPSKSPLRWQFVVDLEPGDVLFLPALWYHQIEILNAGVNVSVNYWHTPFDDEVRWAQWNFMRHLIQLTN